jgi:hypothetical protein
MARLARRRHRTAASVVGAVSLVGSWLAPPLAPSARGAPLSPRIANYRIEARYDAATHTIAAHQVLQWRNTTAEAAPDLWFHLYLNAFANNRSSFMREAGKMGVRWSELHPHGWGYLDVQSLRVDGADLKERMRFVHPDDDNIDDRTVVRVPLDQPVAPGESVAIELDFVARLPQLLSRSGHAGPFALVAQWFPKIGVYEDGRWNCHQYHVTTEFFADFGVYDVTLTVPRDGVVGATGVLRDTHEDATTKTLHFVAEDVHDFAWTIDPRFQVLERTVDGIALRLLVQPRHRAQAERYLQATRSALARYQRDIGPYPYPQLTIVDPAPGGRAAAGMEYPTLMTVGTAWWIPRAARLPEAVTVHEFGHQYWQGMVANNESEDAWLDEGINTYLEGRIMEKSYGPRSYFDLFGLRADGAALNRLQYIAAAPRDPIMRPAWLFRDRASYAAISYGKMALALETLATFVGEDTVRQALADYFARWRFRHPRGEDFVASMQESIGQELGWYFDQVLSGTQSLDYAVTQVTAEEFHGTSGYAPSANGVGEEVTVPGPQQRQYHSEVVVERLGEMALPVDIQITFDDGGVTKERWDGKERWKRFEYTGGQRVEWAVVDELPLDVNMLNNSRMRAAGTRGLVRLAGRWGFWFQNLMTFVTGL